MSEIIKDELLGFELIQIEKLPVRVSSRGYARQVITRFKEAGYRCCLLRKNEVCTTTLAANIRAFIRKDVARNDAKLVGNIRAFRVDGSVYLINYDIEDRKSDVIIKSSEKSLKDNLKPKRKYGN